MSVGTEEEIRKAHENSAKVAERYLALNPDDALALSRAANNLILLGEKDKGVEWAERAYSINPHFCRYNVACALARAGEVDDAMGWLAEARKAGFDKLDLLDGDDDLAPLRARPDWPELRRAFGA